MPNYKLSKELKKRMEKELRQYWDNVHKLEILEKEIIEETSSGDGQPRSNTTSDPTSQKALKLISTRSLALLSERILYVSKTINRLKPFEKDIFNLIFKENKDWLYCETMKGVSKTTYYNIMNKSIYYLAEEWRRNIMKEKKDYSIYNSLEESLKEVKLHKEGKIHLDNWNDFLIKLRKNKICGKN